MMLGNTRFWMDGLCLRSSNYKTHDQPFEAGLRRYWCPPGLKVYEDEAERGGTEVRLSVEALWFYVNMLLFYTSRETRRWDDSGRSWGFYFMDRINFVFRWGKKYFSFDLPFIASVFVKHEILSLDRKRVVHLCGRGIDDMNDIETAKQQNSGTFDYKYELLNGDAQNVKATVCVERWTRRWKWTPIKSSSDSIWVKFHEEVGPRRGSWKGGVTGCGWTMLSRETVPQCLRRMERERRFER